VSVAGRQGSSLGPFFSFAPTDLLALTSIPDGSNCLGQMGFLSNRYRLRIFIFDNACRFVIGFIAVGFKALGSAITLWSSICRMASFARVKLIRSLRPPSVRRIRYIPGHLPSGTIPSASFSFWPFRNGCFDPQGITGFSEMNASSVKGFNCAGWLLRLFRRVLGKAHRAARSPRAMTLDRDSTGGIGTIRGEVSQ
jgi:hypothetical protein